MTNRALSTSRIGMPAIGLLGLSRASGFTTSFAPITTATSGTWTHDGRDSSAATRGSASFLRQPPFSLRLILGLLERAPVVLASSCFQNQLQSRRRLLRHLAIRNIRVPDELEPHSIHEDIFRESWFFLLSTADCLFCLRTQLVCRYNENRIRNRIRDIDDSEISSLFTLADRDPRVITATDILQRPAENIFNFLLRNVVLVDVGQSGYRIDVIADMHAGILAPSIAPTE